LHAHRSTGAQCCPPLWAWGTGECEIKKLNNNQHERHEPVIYLLKGRGSSAWAYHSIPEASSDQVPKLTWNAACEKREK
jgi:hypothetical protein